MLRPCLTCQEPADGSYCDTHKPKRLEKKSSAVARGYDHAWNKLSRRARRLQPWCLDCGTSGTPDNPLTGDHLRWPARSLRDIAVRCRSCNSKKGALRERAIA